jgi:release factor glutamine methyltransferase
MLQEIGSKDIFNQINSSLVSVYEETEAQNIAFWLLEKLLLLPKQEIMLNKKVLQDMDLFQNNLSQALARLLRHEPIQYVLGEAYFYGLDLMVSPAVLIPRPETEELVHLIIQENHLHTHLVVLDIGTGSGCIPIVLAKSLSEATIYAIDISEKALDIAKKNAKKYHVFIHFLQIDILNENLLNDSFPTNLVFDIIVSNPPYIREIEKEKMYANVLDYEPSTALFVPDDEPLLFYKKIAFFAQKRLKIGGKLYFEVSEYFGNEVIAYLTFRGFKEIRLIKDLQGKDRIVACKSGKIEEDKLPL